MLPMLSDARKGILKRTHLLPQSIAHETDETRAIESCMVQLAFPPLIVKVPAVRETRQGRLVQLFP